MLITLAALLVAVAGILLWALAGGDIIKKIGEGSYYIGLFYVVGALAKTSVNVGSMLVAFAPLFIALGGLLIWVLAGNPITKRAGAGAFFIGLFYVVGALSSHTVRVF